MGWSGSTAAGYETYDRSHQVRGPEPLALSADAAFGGDPSRWNPEQLLVAAAASCQLLEFLAIMARARLDVLSYDDDAQGFMDEADDPPRIGRIVLRPRVTVAAGTDVERVRRYLDLAHEHCYIANSLRSEIVLEPEVVTGG